MTAGWTRGAALAYERGNEAIRGETMRAFVFPGQGAQVVGMGRDLAEAYPAARAVFDEVDEALGEKLSAVIWEGDAAALTLTENAQPALMATSIAAMRALEAEGVPASSAGYVAGHSLGEYSALCAVGAMRLGDTARMLRLRGRAMQAAVPVGVGAMAAVLGLDLAAVEAVAAEAAEGEVCEAANDNDPGQVVVSGHRAAVERAVGIARERGAADKLDARLKLEAHWLERGVTARRKRNQGRLAKLHDMRIQRAAMLSPAGTAKLKVVADETKTKSVIVAEHVTKSFAGPTQPEPVEGRTRASKGPARAEVGAKTIIRDFNLRIQRGDRIGIVGANGAGKTTLLKLLTGEIAPDEGEVTLAKTLTGTVIDQQRSLLTPEKRLRDVLAEGGDWIDVRGVRKHVQGYLKEFLFDPGLVDAKVGTLSGGERSRLLLAREFARRSNLLVLDEPTNDLDLETLDLLQEVIADYEGTVMIVSHDRDFLDRTVTVTLGLDGSGSVDIVAGGYADWEAKRRTRTAPAPRRADRAPADAPRRRRAPSSAFARPAVVQGPARLRSAAGPDRGTRRCDSAERGRARRPRAVRSRSGEVRRDHRRARPGPDRQGDRRAALAGTCRDARGIANPSGRLSPGLPPPSPGAPPGVRGCAGGSPRPRRAARRPNLSAHSVVTNR